MPVFHTKTIESILEPVAQQTASVVMWSEFLDTDVPGLIPGASRIILCKAVSRLVILHEEAEDGNAMPDLERPVMAVSRAVTNLVKVGRETINSSDDAILKQDMPSALVRVEGASKFLEEASGMKKLIEGSRGILQGTSSLLLCFDESEVRKIIRECKRVLDYLAVAEVIETMEDLVQFLKDLSPCLSKVSREVTAREKELTHQVHREILVRCLEQVKTLAPILICSMKIFIHIIGQGGKGVDEAAENRNYLSQRMTDEINEIIRVLQLTTYDEEEWDADNLTVMKKSYNAIEGKIRTAHDWLEDPLALRGGVGEKSVRQILDHAYKVAERSLPHDADTIRKQCSDITTMTDALCELRQEGKGATPQAEALSRGIQDKLRDLYTIVNRAVQGVEKSGIQQPAHTVAEGLPGVHRAEILGLCDEVDILSRQLSDLCRRGHGNSPQAQDIARNLSQRLYDLKDRIQNAVVNRVVEDFIDISTPLKQFTDAVHVPEGTPGREQNFGDKAQQLQHFSTRASKTARMVAAGGSGGNKKLAEALLTSSSQVESLTPQLISAGRIRMNYPESKAADEHFQNLVSQYSDSILRVRSLCDEATESADFIKMSEEQIQKHTILCEEAIRKSQPQKMVDNTSSIARLANRVLMVAKQESDNSEDPKFISRVNQASDSLQTSVTPMVQDAKSVAMNIQDHVAISHYAPPRPPLPGGEMAPPRPPPPETDDEDDMFLQAPLPNQPIMMAAHGLHQEVRQWSSKDNNIIVAAKKMAVLMGRLSRLVRGEGGSKRDLIACAKAIAEASEEVTRLAKELARECTDKRMRTNLLQVCERIPTIGTQLKILSTVKATMLGAQGTEEDQEATDMLVGNAQNLMQSVKETVRAAESASIKIRTDAGIQLRWVRKQPWYQY
uniref:Vinculin n=1 Tax=Timema genevievae TaxID=629358 RepID=A0A7R9JZG5_TIMGE|nr:unnamed protein product [Timema genevievae]